MATRKILRASIAMLLLMLVVPFAGHAQVVSGSAQATASGGDIEVQCPGCTTSFTNFAGVGDIDKDGKADMALTVADKGITYFVKGPGPATGTTIKVPGAEFATFVLPSGTPTHGLNVAAAGDVNGDGSLDVLIGVPGFDRAYVLYGPFLGQLTPASSGVATIVGEVGSLLGTSMAAAGDVNGDGKGDILLGAPGLGSTSTGSAGGAYLVRGPINGSVNLPAAAVAKMTGPAGSKAGSAVAAGRDLLGDAAPDLVIGAFDYDTQGVLDRGATFVISGSMTGNFPLQGSGAMYVGQSAKDRSGWSVAVGNLIGDTHADLIIGAPGKYYVGVDGGDGAVFIVPGPVSTEPTTLPARGTNKLVGEYRSNAGSAVAIGYLNGDGGEDLIVGAPTLGGNGKVYVQFGPVSPSFTNLSGASAIRSGGPGFGGQVASPGDIDHACYGDLMAGYEVSASVFVDHETECGPVTGLVVSPSQQICTIILDPLTGRRRCVLRVVNSRLYDIGL